MRFYSPQLDGLRFCAAFAVFVHHAPRIWGLGRLRDYGWLGVDLFLAISAYLITKLLLLEREQTGAISLKSFYVRRALRIWPLYFSFVTIMSLAAFAAGKISAAESLGWWLTHITFSNNIVTAVKGFSPIPFTSHLWTISLEEQAYLILPLAVLVFSRTKRVMAICLALIAILVAARLAVYLLYIPHPFVWVSPLRGDAFVLGCLAAFVVANPRAWMFWTGAAVMGLVTLFPPVGQHSAYDVIGYTIAATGCTAMVVGSQAFKGGVLAWRPMRYLGKISYGFYVFHLGIVQKVTALGFPPLVTFLVALILTIAVSAASYALLERPFLKLKQRFELIAARPV